VKKVFAIVAVGVILFTGSFAYIAAAEGKGGCGPCLVGCIWGPRTGYMYNEGVKLRTMEWLRLVPVVGYIAYLIELFDVMGGKTWSEVESAEGL